jgi:hypothetical protein
MSRKPIESPWGVAKRLRSTVTGLCDAVIRYAQRQGKDWRGKMAMKDHYAETRPSSWSVDGQVPRDPISRRTDN